MLDDLARHREPLTTTCYVGSKLPQRGRCRLSMLLVSVIPKSCRSPYTEVYSPVSGFLYKDEQDVQITPTLPSVGVLF